jgi:hypothetical protein
MPDEKRIHCKAHAVDGEIDVVSKRCSVDGCDKQPVYAIPGKKAVHCKTHAVDGEIDVKNKQCSADGCDTQPSYALPGEKAVHCKVHAVDGEIDVKHERCITCLSTFANRKYAPNCARCHYYLHPDDSRIRNYKTREQAFMLPLKELYPDMILDQVIAGGCSRRRPDGLLDCLTHVIIIEIDEDQHIGYDSTCDNRRTMEIFNDLGDRPIIFIRLNPDGYTHEGKRIGKTFSITHGGDLKLNKSEFSRRALLQVLKVTTSKLDWIDLVLKRILIIRSYISMSSARHSLSRMEEI